jgi:DNA-binding CsgD family transcriptional regulator
MQKRKAAGLPCGRPKVRNEKEILRLHKLGFSYRKIAAQLGISTHPVYKTIKEAK